MKTEVTVRICDNHFELKTINIKDAEVLRLWKNEHKEFFFYNKEISSQEQQDWIKSLSKRLNDYMFIISEDKIPVGCIGSRLLDDYVDIYNVILGNKEYKGKHVMKNALWAVVSLCNLIYMNKSIRVSVLNNNPAIKWYEKIGFQIIDRFQDYVLMQFENSIIDTQYDFKINITLPTI